MCLLKVSLDLVVPLAMFSVYLCIFSLVFVVEWLDGQAPLSRGDWGIASGGSHIKLRRKEVSQVTIGPISFAHTQSPNIKHKNVKILNIMLRLALNGYLHLLYF